MSLLFISDDQNTGASASASVLPVNIQGWSLLRLTGLNSLLFKGLSGVFSITMFWRHQFFGILPSLWSRSHNHTWPLGGPEPWLYGPLLAEQCHHFLAKKQSSSNFMAAVTICSDFRAQAEEICHYFHLFPFYLPWSNGARCHDLSFF